MVSWTPGNCRYGPLMRVGNRSPLADNKMRGMITGLALDDHLTDLAAKFNVTLEVSPGLCVAIETLQGPEERAALMIRCA